MSGFSHLSGRHLLLVISGGIAAYKSLELIRRLRERGVKVTCILTAGGAQFVTPLSVSALAESKVYSELWSLTDEQAMGHIRLSRMADLIVVAPASANMIAKMAQGLADDLASTVLLASDKPVMIAPAMNPVMWAHPATQANMATLVARGVRQIGPSCGAMACGETGAGRMAEPMDILAAIENFFAKTGPLTGKRALVTSGPTHEPIDPVRYIANRSSGKQGHAIAVALAALGANVTLVTGPVALPDPQGLRIVHVETAAQMLDACLAALPVDIAVCAAAVADWRPVAACGQKIKKGGAVKPPRLEMAENPDILATLAQRTVDRPKFVVGFAAETEKLADHAAAKLASKACDWILANDVSGGQVFGADQNKITLFGQNGLCEPWPLMGKDEIARELATKIAFCLQQL